METRANHVLIGAFTLAGLALIVIIGLWSARYATERDWQYIEIEFTQPVSGLSVGSDVQYNGIRMGSVRELSLAADDPGRVVARVRLEGDAPLREDTVARLSVSGLTGVAFIQLRGGSPESAPLKPGPDGEPPRIMAEESPLQRLIDSSEDIASTASEVMLRLLDFLSEENADRVSQTLDNIDRLTVALTDERDLISESIGNIHRGSEDFAQVAARSRAIIEDLSEALARLEGGLVDTMPAMAEDLERTIDRLARTSERIERILAENEAALAGFGVEVLSPLGPAVEEFRQLVRDLSRLSSRIERDPARFLLGRDQPMEYQPQ
ncbi:MAG: MlaD family protein [Wenzhouxiangella sp.]